MNTKKPTLGAGKQMSRPVTKLNALPQVPEPLEVKPVEVASSVSLNTSRETNVEIPVWAHLRGQFEGRKPTVTTETLRGVTHSGYPFETLEINQPVYLIPDPFGQVVKPEEGHNDPTAISVQDNFVSGKHIGYLSKTVAATITKYLNKGYQYEADILAIKGGYAGIGGEMLNYGVDIVVRFYPAKE